MAGNYGGGYYTHMRNEGDLLLEAIDEALQIGRDANTPVHIFHLKAAGRQNWGKMQLAIAKIKAARAEGQQVTADIYPYVNNGLGIAAFIHPRHFSQGRARLLNRLGEADLRQEIREEMESTGGWENWYRHVGRDWDRVVIGQANDRRYADLAGQTVAEMARQRDEDPWDTFFNLAQSGAFALPQSMTDANKILAIQQDFVSFCTRRRSSRRFANCFASAGVRIVSALVVTLCTRPGRDLLGTRRGSSKCWARPTPFRFVIEAELRKAWLRMSLCLTMGLSPTRPLFRSQTDRQPV